MTETKSGYRTLENTGYGPKSDYRFPDVPPGAVVKFTLVDDLVSYWPLNEQSGQRNDVVGANHLTDNATVLAVNRGPAGTVASFVAANNEYLTRDSSGLGVSAGVKKFSYAVWVKALAPTKKVIVQIGGYPGFTFDASGATISLTAQYYDGSGWHSTGGDSGVTSDVGWHLVVLEIDADTGGTLKVWMDGTQVGSSTATVALYDSSVVGSYIGYNGSYTDGHISGLGAWSRVLTAGERTSLFASGNGKTYADLTTAEKVGLVSYWNLDEASGQRNDSHGTNHLTDNNTVGSVVNAGGAMDGAAAVMAEANAESLSTAISVSGNFSVSMWLNEIVPGGFNIGFHDGATKAQFIASDASGSFIAAIGAVDESDLAAGTAGWNHVILEWDSVAETATIYVNNSTSASVVLTGGVPVISSFSIPFSDGTGGVFSADEVAIWSRVLTSDERAELYNAGAGFFYNATTEDFE